jgi:hypothetical protein
MRDLWGKCGCNCGRCPAYYRNAKTKAAKERCSTGWAKYLGAKLKPEQCYCLGCQSRDPWETANTLPDRSCTIRACVINNDIPNCAYCSRFPCDALKMRIPDENFRGGIEARLGAPITDEDYRVFVEPYEGQKHLSEIRAGLKPDEIVDPAEPKPLKARLVKLPDDISGSAADKAGAKSVHHLLATLISAPTETYAQQEILKRGRNNILLILWVFGHLGELATKQGTLLVIDSIDCGDRSECDSVIRKHDNSLQIAARQSVAVLAGFGVQVNHTPIGPDHWILSMSFDRRAGGSRAVKALKRYVAVLISEYGEPVYSGASRYKGKAFQLFSRADMRVLAG